MTQEYEDIKCFTCGQVRGKRKVVRFGKEDKLKFEALETKIRHCGSVMFPFMGMILVFVLPAYVLAIQEMYGVIEQIPSMRSWPLPAFFLILGMLYIPLGGVYIFIIKRRFEKVVVRTQELIHEQKNILTRYGVEDKDDYIIR